MKPLMKEHRRVSRQTKRVLRRDSKSWYIQSETYNMIRFSTVRPADMSIDDIRRGLRSYTTIGPKSS